MTNHAPEQHDIVRAYVPADSLAAPDVFEDLRVIARNEANRGGNPAYEELVGSTTLKDGTNLTDVILGQVSAENARIKERALRGMYQDAAKHVIEFVVDRTAGNITEINSRKPVPADQEATNRNMEWSARAPSGKKQNGTSFRRPAIRL